MIEDKKIGLKIAENPREARLTKIKDNLTEQICNAEMDIELNNVILNYLKDKLKSK